MPQSQEKTPEQTTELPNPELNPLLNPTLGRHLGRWAQVYFTSPPEKREEAVEELLRELQGIPGASPDDSAVLPNDPITHGAESIRIIEAAPDPLGQQCTQCRHPYTSPQRFCGMCGATLEGEQAAPSGTVSPSVRMRTIEPTFRPTVLPSLTPIQQSAEPSDDGYSDVRWLRDKRFSGEETSWARARYAPAIIAVLAIGILFYAQSRPQKAPGQQPAKTTQSAVETPKTSTPPAATTSIPEKPPVEKATESAPVSNPRSSDEQTKTTPPVPATAPSAVERRRAPAQDAAGFAGTTESASALNTANGAAELAMAEDFLNGKTHPRSSEEAAKYLWRAVGKENPTAILLLSDMYLVGEGVPRSCDQARLLLSAAAKKGVPQAAEKLSKLLRSGCPK